MKPGALCLLGWLATLAPEPASAREPRTMPFGLDAYRQSARWPNQRINARASMRNSCVCSNPRGELGETQHTVRTSNRRLLGTTTPHLTGLLHET